MKKRVNMILSWLAAVAACGGIFWLLFADADAICVLEKGVASGVGVLLGGLSDALYNTICSYAAGGVALLLAALLVGMLWSALCPRVRGERLRGCVVCAAVTAALTALAFVLALPGAGDGVRFVGLSVGIALGGFGCLACVLLYGWLKNAFPKVFNRETVSYIVFGVLTTVVSFVSQMIFHSMGWITVAATVGSWICAVLFAYVVNKLFVFESHTDTAAAFFREMGLFFGARLASLGFEIAFMWLAVDILHFPDAVCKIAVQFIILVLNYLFSKWIIFKKKTNE